MSRRPGFTLIELLIVAAVFSLTALVATTVITRIQTTQRQILGKQRVAADGRYVVETMARAVRQGTIDYNYYLQAAASPAAELQGAQNLLAVINQTGPNNSTQYICFRLNANQIQTTSGTSSCTASSTWSSITPSDLVVTNFSAWISPHSDPFAPTPQQSGDCAVPTSTPAGLRGFDSTRGVCACQFATGGSDCFPNQQCMTTSIGNAGSPCLNAGDASCLCKNANQQPEVTISISTNSKSQAAGEASHANLQTTVASHVYRR